MTSGFQQDLSYCVTGVPVPEGGTSIICHNIDGYPQIQQDRINHATLEHLRHTISVNLDLNKFVKIKNNISSVDENIEIDYIEVKSATCLLY